MMKLEKPLAIIISVIIDSGKKNQAEAKGRGKVWGAKAYWHHLKVSPHKIRIYYRGENINFTVEKPYWSDQNNMTSNTAYH